MIKSLPLETDFFCFSLSQEKADDKNKVKKKLFSNFSDYKTRSVAALLNCRRAQEGRSKGELRCRNGFGPAWKDSKYWVFNGLGFSARLGDQEVSRYCHLLR